MIMGVKSFGTYPQTTNMSLDFLHKPVGFFGSFWYVPRGGVFLESSIQIFSD